MAELSRTDASSLVDAGQTLKAAKALIAHIRKTATEQAADATKRSLLDDSTETDLPSAVAESPIWLDLTAKRHIHPSSKLKPGKIVVPHPLNDPSDTDATICLITADPQRAYKNIIASSAFPNALRSRITRVIDYTHIRAKISKSYEAQRKLASEHTVFLADDRIINRLPQALGKSFYKTTAKRPIPVVLMPSREKVDGKRLKRPKKNAKQTKKEEELEEHSKYARPTEEIAAEIEKAVAAVVVNLNPSTDVSLRIGYASWSPEKIAANAEVVAAALVERFIPQKWNNIRSIYIKGQNTAALPIWQTDELWMNGAADVLPEGSEEKLLPAPGGKGRKEKANVGKKRKISDADAEAEAEVGGDTNVDVQEAAPKAKRPKKKTVLPESNDDKLDEMIAERKTKLKKQKDGARKAVEA